MAGKKTTNSQDTEALLCGFCDRLFNNLGPMADILNGCTCPILSSSSIDTINNDFNRDYINLNQWSPDELSRTEYFPDENTDYNPAVNGLLAYNMDPIDMGYAMVANVTKHVNFQSPVDRNAGIYETPASVQFENVGGYDDTGHGCAACEQLHSRYNSAGVPVPGDVPETKVPRVGNNNDCVINCWYDKKKNSLICSYDPKDNSDSDSDSSSKSCSSFSPVKTNPEIPSPEKLDKNKLPSGNFSLEVGPKPGDVADPPRTCSLFFGPGHSHPKLLGDIQGKIDGEKPSNGKAKPGESDECSLNTVLTAEIEAKRVNFEQDSKATDSDANCIEENKANERREADAKKAEDKYVAENEENERREEEERCRKNEEKAKKHKDGKKCKKEKRKECDLREKSVTKDKQNGQEKEKCAGRVCHSKVCGELCALGSGKKSEKTGKNVDCKEKADAPVAEKKKKDRRCNHSSTKRSECNQDDDTSKKCTSPKTVSCSKNVPTPKVSFKDCQKDRRSKSPPSCDLAEMDNKNCKRSNSCQTSNHKIKSKKRCESRARSKVKRSLEKFLGGKSSDNEPKSSCLCAFVCERSKNDCGKKVCCSKVKKKRSKSETRLRSGKNQEVMKKERRSGSFQMTFEKERPQLMPVKKCWSKNSREVIEDAIKKLEDIEKKSLSGILTPPRVCSEEPEFYDAIDSAHMNTSETNSPKENQTRDQSLDHKSLKKETCGC